MSVVEHAIIEKVLALPLEKQQEVLRFVEGLAAPSPETVPADAELRRMTIWEEIDEIVQEVPAEAWAELPADGSINVDHYLYGAPKRQ